MRPELLTHVATGPCEIPRFSGLFPEAPDGRPATLCGARGTARDTQSSEIVGRHDACAECVKVATEGGQPVREKKPRKEKASAYAEFLIAKTQLAEGSGFRPQTLPPYLYDFQEALVAWALERGRAGIFADCGMGKTPMQLAWADEVVRHTNRPVLILTPLAVSGQTMREGEKFGVECRAPGAAVEPCVYVTNYERLHRLDANDYAGVVCDESSILKSFDGVTREAVTRFMARHRFRLLCTATAAPNDTTELGTSSEALGHLGHIDMLNRFFQNNRNNSAVGLAYGKQQQWRFRGHAEQPFWRWVSSWARSLRRPSDLGFDDSRFALPALVEQEHTVKANRPREGMLFALPAHGLSEEREERRRTLVERCEMSAALVANTGQPAVAWCHLNDEGDLLAKLIPGSVQVSGKDSDEEKEEKFAAFADGSVRVLVTKPIIGAWGLNWQHCAHMTSFASHSFEQYYQSVRRFWRYGQTKRVVVDHVLSDGEGLVLANLQRKARDADNMFASITRHMRDAQALARSTQRYEKKEEVPAWL